LAVLENDKKGVEVIEEEAVLSKTDLDSFLQSVVKNI
jgi:hypothetical protein